MTLKNKNIFFIAIASLCILGSCNQQKQRPTDETSERIAVEKKDNDMNRAIQQAQETLGKFQEALKSGNYTDYALKVAFSGNDTKEHLWLTNIVFDGTNYSGELANEPRMIDIDSLHLGNHINIDTKDISDWKFIDESKDEVHGAFTIQVLKKKMTPQELEMHKEAMSRNYVDSLK